jgi:hypothetical protein
MDELTTASDDIHAGEYQKYENAVEQRPDQRSDREIERSASYVAVVVDGTRERVTVWTSPTNDRSRELARLANRVLARELTDGDCVPSD